MLKQVSLLPSGCQINKVHLRLLLFFNEKYIIYASSIAIYVINANTFTIEKILSFEYKAIIAFSICSKNNNLIAVCTIDNSIYLANIEDESIISKFQLSNVIDVMWLPHSATQCGIISMDNHIKLYEWDTSRLDRVSELLVIKNNTLKYTMARWNTNLDGQIAVGCTNNIILLFHKVTKQQSTLPSPEDIASIPNQIVDIQWDRLSPNYLLVAYQYFLSLWDTERGTLIHTYEIQTLPITAIAWLDWTAGCFVTSNSKNTNLKLWNASQKVPLENIRFNYNTMEAAGIHNIILSPGTKRILCANKCGSISVLNMKTSQVEYVSSEGHNETIFDCALSPTNPDQFCTASYDHSIKIWSIHDLLTEKTLYSNENAIIYSCDWSPNSQMIVGSCGSGIIHIWEVESGMELARYAHHNKPSYNVQWNQNIDNLIASTSADCTIVVFQVELLNELQTNEAFILRSNSSRKKSLKNDKNQLQCNESNIKFKYTHPGIVYGCNWNPIHANVLTTTCHDGYVRVFNIIYGLLHVLKGHSKRSFGVAWSLIIPNLLASSSDDLCVNVWDVNLKMNISDLSKPHTKQNNDSNVPSLLPIKILKGHTSNVRALCWNYELDYLLLSGSWDYSIRLWDIHTGQCLSIITDHIADVYSISSHPERPFTYISTSRDTTIRIWELTDMITLIKYKSIYDKCFNRILSNHSMIDNDLNNEDNTTTGYKEVEGINETYNKSKLIGKFSSILNEKLYKFQNNKIDKIQLATNYYKLFSFFNGASDAMELWENVLTVLGDNSNLTSSITATTTIQHQPQQQLTQSFHGLSIHKLLRNIKYRKINNENEIIELARSEARKLESSNQRNVRKTDISSKVEEQLRNAAMLYACTGDFKKYCTLMIDIGDWTSALAMAPSVSYEYWKELTQRYGEVLAQKSSENCIPYLLGIGRDIDAIEFYLQRQDTMKSMMIAKMSEQRTDLIPEYRINERLHSTTTSTMNINNTTRTQFQSPVKLNHNSTTPVKSSFNSPEINKYQNSSNHMINIRDRTTKEIDDSRIIVNIVGNYSVKLFLEQGRPILAAAQYLAIGEIDNSIQVLCDNDIYDMAYALSICFDCNTTFICIELANQCMKLHDIDFAIEILQNIPNKNEEIGLLISKYLNEKDAIDINNKYNLISFKEWEAKSIEEIAIGSDTEAVICKVITMNYNEAIRIGLNVLKQFVRNAIDITSSIKKLIYALKHIKAIEVTEITKRNEFLISILWFSAHDAISVGMFQTGYNMLKKCYDTYCTASKDNENLQNILQLTENDLRIQCLCFHITTGDRSVVTLLASTLQYYSSHQNESNMKIITILTELLQYIKNAPDEISFKSMLSSFSLKKYFINQQQQFNEDGIWGDHTIEIFRLIEELCDILKLPNIGSYILNKYLMKTTDQQQLIEVKSSLYMKHADSIIHGSLLPSSHQHQKISYISNKRLKGRMISINDNENTYISINELINWKRKYPYSPVMDGSFL